MRNIKDIKIKNNDLENSNITITSSNAIVSKNQIVNSKETEESFACRYLISGNEQNNYTIYHTDNTIIGNYKKYLDIQENEKLKVIIDQSIQ